MQTIFLTIKQVAGYAVGGGHVLHMVCDLTIAADNAIFGQTGPKVLESSAFSYKNLLIEHVDKETSSINNNINI